MTEEETIIECKILAGTLFIAVIICGSITFGVIKVPLFQPRQNLDDVKYVDQQSKNVCFNGFNLFEFG